MTTKLTLTLDDKVIQRAKKYAKSNGQSVSEMVESYFKSLTGTIRNKEEQISPLVKSLKGSFKAPANFDYKKVLGEQIRRKYE